MNAAGQAPGSAPFPFDPSSFTVFRSIAEDGSSNGMLVYATLTDDESQTETWWSVSAGGAMMDVRVLNDAEPERHAAFSAVVGKNLQQLQSATTDSALAERCTLAVLAILKANGMFE